MKKHFSRLRGDIALVLVSLFFLFIVMELGIRIHDLFVNNIGFFSEDKRSIFTKYAKGALPFGFKLYLDEEGGKFISSRHGELFPFEKRQGTFRIVCFGGSTTEQLIDGEHYPLLLQNLLKDRLNKEDIEVINIGNSAFATPHFLILLELHVLYWKPDLIILSENINDLSVWYWPNFSSDYSNKYSHSFYLPPVLAGDYPIANVIFKHSRLFWFLRKRAGKIISSVRRVPIRRKSYGTMPGHFPSEVFEKNLRTFIAIAKSNGIPVLLSSQPLQPSEEYFDRHFIHKPYNNDIYYPLHEEFVAHHCFFNGLIKKVGADTGSLFIDNDAFLAGGKEYFIDAVHYTKQGLEKIASNFADFLIAEKVIQ